MRRFDEQGDVSRAIAGGVIAGIIGGLLNALVAFLTVSAGGDIWTAFKGAGAPFLGERSAEPGYDPFAVAVGFFGHYLVSIGWGVVFGLLVYGMDRAVTVLAGAAFGLIVWLGMYWVVLPLVGLGAMSAQGANGLTALLHVLFGLTLGIVFLPFQVPKRIQRRHEPVLP